MKTNPRNEFCSKSLKVRNAHFQSFSPLLISYKIFFYIFYGLQQKVQKFARMSSWPPPPPSKHITYKSIWEEKEFFTRLDWLQGVVQNPFYASSTYILRLCLAYFNIQKRMLNVKKVCTTSVPDTIAWKYNLNCYKVGFVTKRFGNDKSSKNLNICLMVWSCIFYKPKIYKDCLLFKILKIILKHFSLNLIAIQKKSWGNQT